MTTVPVNQEVCRIRMSEVLATCMCQEPLVIKRNSLTVIHVHVALCPGNSGNLGGKSVCILLYLATSV